MTSTYVKLSFGRYFLELDLPNPIDDTVVTASAKHGILTVTLPKAIKGGEAWGSLTLPPSTNTTTTTTGLDKQSIQERRAAAVEEQRAREQRRAEEARGRRAEMEEATFRAQVG